MGPGKKIARKQLIKERDKEQTRTLDDSTQQLVYCCSNKSSLRVKGTMEDYQSHVGGSFSTATAFVGVWPSAN